MDDQSRVLSELRDRLQSLRQDRELAMRGSSAGGSGDVERIDSEIERIKAQAAAILMTVPSRKRAREDDDEDEDALPEMSRLKSAREMVQDEMNRQKLDALSAVAQHFSSGPEIIGDRLRVSRDLKNAKPVDLLYAKYEYYKDYPHEHYPSSYLRSVLESFQPSESTIMSRIFGDTRAKKYISTFPAQILGRCVAREFYTCVEGVWTYMMTVSPETRASIVYEATEYLETYFIDALDEGWLIKQKLTKFFKYLSSKRFVPSRNLMVKWMFGMRERHSARGNLSRMEIEHIPYYVEVYKLSPEMFVDVFDYDKLSDRKFVTFDEKELTSQELRMFGIRKPYVYWSEIVPFLRTPDTNYTAFRDWDWSITKIDRKPTLEEMKMYMQMLEKGYRDQMKDDGKGL
jgi:hypothetical protein